VREKGKSEKRKSENRKREKKEKEKKKKGEKEEKRKRDRERERKRERKRAALINKREPLLRLLIVFVGVDDDVFGDLLFADVGSVYKFIISCGSRQFSSVVS
jgi:hypothetical protein